MKQQRQKTMAIQILEIKQNTDEWFKARKGRVTGSNSDVLLTSGVLTALRSNDESSNFRGNYYTQRGHDMEPMAIHVYEQVYSTIVERPGFVINDDYPNAGCSPDGIDGQWLLEIKCFGERRHLMIRGYSDIEYKIMSQLQFNMMISDLKKARLVLYNPEVKDPTLAFNVIEVEADMGIWANFKRKLIMENAA